jgi:hypothetical protein
MRKFIDILEGIENTTKLYRGDASEIHNFDIEKTDDWALFGRGLYLTDDPTVAKDYTLKGSEHTEFTSDTARSAKQLIDQYLEHIMKTHLDLEKLFAEIDDKARAEARVIQNQMYDGSPKLTYEEYKEKEKEILQRIRTERLATTKRLKPNAKKILLQQGHLSVVRNTVGHWSIVKDTGYVSTFDVPNDIISRCLHADRPLPDAVISAVKKFFHQNFKGGGDDPVMDMRDKKQQFLTFDKWIEEYKTHGVYYADAEEYGSQASHIGGKGQNPSLEHLWRGNFTGIWMFQKNQTAFIELMKSIGYVGLEYDGGVRIAAGGGGANRGGGGHRHHAYVFWDTAMISQHRSTIEKKNDADKLANHTQRKMK